MRVRIRGCADDQWGAPLGEHAQFVKGDGLVAGRAGKSPARTGSRMPHLPHLGRPGRGTASTALGAAWPGYRIYRTWGGLAGVPH
jgi:hypothetical protein